MFLFLRCCYDTVNLVTRSLPMTHCHYAFIGLCKITVRNYARFGLGTIVISFSRIT